MVKLLFVSVSITYALLIIGAIALNIFLIAMMRSKLRNSDY